MAPVEETRKLPQITKTIERTSEAQRTENNTNYTRTSDSDSEPSTELSDSTDDLTHASGDDLVGDLQIMDTSSNKNNLGISVPQIINGSESRSASSTSSIPTCVVAPTSNSYHSGDMDIASSSDGENGNFIPTRKQREFIPEEKKDDHYWEKRRKNNEAARRSREKRRTHDVALENRIVDLTRDNCQLRNELYAVKKKFGLPLTERFVPDDEEETNPSVSMANTAMSTPNSRATNTPPGMPRLISGSMVARPPGHPNQSPQVMPFPGNMAAMAVPFQGSYNANLPVPFYVAVPPTDNYRQNIALPSSNTSTSLASSSYDLTGKMPVPAHSQYNESESNVKPSLTPSKKPDSQENLYYSHPSSTSLPSSYLSRPRGSNSPEETDLYTQTQNSSSSALLHTYENSNDSYSQDEPLSLTVRKRGDSFSGNESSMSCSSSDSPTSYSPPTMALPHKLRHKVPPELGQNIGSMSYDNGLTQLSEIALAQSGPIPLLKKSHHEEEHVNRRKRSLIDPKYAERRRKNNEAARKCRENRKTLTRIREVKSEYLASENGKLRNEVEVLHEEMKQLRELIESKKLNETPNDEDKKPSVEHVHIQYAVG
ncbi:hypothetical protein KUTeg_016049, partial [Tegillarca granosa]